MIHLKRIGYCFILICITSGLKAQTFYPLSKIEIGNYNQLAKDSIKLRSYRPVISNYTSDKVVLLDFESGLLFNSSYARSYNDGPIWQGKGATTYFSGGLQKKYKQLHITLNPIIYYSQNVSFPLQPKVSNNNEYEYQYTFLGTNIDYVQRYGNKSFAIIHPGQSEIAFRGKNIEVGLSTQNFTLGPASYQSIMMSNGGSGFPYFNFGTSRPIPVTLPFSKVLGRDIYLGKIDVHVFEGLLTESKYFDTKNLNKHQFLSGITGEYQLPGIENISIGVNRVLYKNLKYLDSNDWYSFLRSKERTNSSKLTSDSLSYRAFDQMVSFFVNLTIPESDFRFYFEISKNDFNGTIRNFFEEFEHARAYTIGIEKVYPIKNKNLHIHFEQTNLIGSHSYRYRAQAPYYTHTIALQGYTNDGQLLGAGIGPGSASEQLHFNVFKSNNYIGLYLQRIRFNEDYFNKIIPITPYKYQWHDVEYSVGCNALHDFKKFQVQLKVIWSYRYNMYNITYNDMSNIQSNLIIYIPLDKNKKARL